MIFILFSRFLFLVPFFDGFVKSRERRPFRERGDPEIPELLAAHNYIDVQNPIPFGQYENSGVRAKYRNPSKLIISTRNGNLSFTCTVG
jgi:hypothetical protein